MELAEEVIIGTGVIVGIVILLIGVWRSKDGNKDK